MSDERPVELTPAWFWQCPNCKSENFVRVPPVSDTSEFSEDELRTMLKLDPWEEIPDCTDGSFILAPEHVVCVVCLHVFPALEPTVDPDEDLDDVPPTIPDALPKDF